MSFRITGLKFAQFAPLIALSEDELRRRNARRVVADRSPGFPCRVSLVDAQPGERLLLVNYENLPVTSPYRSRHADVAADTASNSCCSARSCWRVRKSPTCTCTTPARDATPRG